MSKEKIQSINFEEGYKEFSINGDPERVIKFNPTDFAIIERAQTARKEIVEASKSIKDEEDEDVEKTAELIKKVDAIIKEKVDYIFGYKISDIVFGLQSPLATKNGITLVERFISGAMPIVQKEIEEEQKKSQAKVSKYTERYHK